MQNEEQPSTSTKSQLTQSGITLVLPSLRALKAAKAGNKSKANVAADSTKKAPPRPVKLKPLKDVLAKLIYQIKRRDDYAFFLKPVDATLIPGYTDVIKNPMDFGTMTSKVERGKYRSLEDFVSDFRLVTMNAKIFNPAGSIYHSEAERIEAWGLDHISKASAHVIEYETNWNIEIENDDDDPGGGGIVNVNIDDEDMSTPRDIDGSMPGASPAPSATPAPTLGRRAPRGSRKVQAGASSTISESLDAEGRLPGSKEGVGAFPPGTPFSELMVALKIKGKRYKTKKERLRFEKEGPPYSADGSLDYAEMEDPFSVLSVFVPDPPSRPQIYPLPSHFSSTTPAPALVTSTTPRPRPGTTRRHWTITRNPPTRSRLKDAENDEEGGQSKSAVPRDTLPGDWGAFAAVLRDDTPAAVTVPTEDGSAAECGDGGGSREAEFWTDEAANQARDYLIDVVYGGPQGYAYVRSVAEFMSRPHEIDDVDVIQGPSHPAPAMNAMPLGMPLARYVETRLIDRVTHGRHSLLRDVFCSSLPFPPPSPVYESEPGVEAPIKPDPDANFDSVPLAHPHRPPSPHLYEQAQGRQHDISPGLARILALPSASSTLAVLRSPLDMAALLRSPEELARASMLEGTGTGKSVENANGSADEEDEDERGAQEVDKKENNVLGEREAIERALIWSAKALEALQWRILVGNEVVPEVGSEVAPDANAAVATVAAPGGALKIEDGGKSGEGGIAMDVDVMAPHAPDDDDPLMKRVRLNLIALAKRAPLDKIARLPAALVPESIRGMVPTV